MSSNIDDLLGSIDDKGGLVDEARKSSSAILISQDPDTGGWNVNVHSINRAQASFAIVLIHEFIVLDLREDDDDE